jgi:hypothetical protein
MKRIWIVNQQLREGEPGIERNIINFATLISINFSEIISP